MKMPGYTRTHMFSALSRVIPAQTSVAVLIQQLGRLLMSPNPGKLNGRQSALILPVRVCPIEEEKPASVEVTILGRVHQRSPTVLVRCVQAVPVLENTRLNGSLFILFINPIDLLPQSRLRPTKRQREFPNDRLCLVVGKACSECPQCADSAYRLVGRVVAGSELVVLVPVLPDNPIGSE